MHAQAPEYLFFHLLFRNMKRDSEKNIDLFKIL